MYVQLGDWSNIVLLVDIVIYYVKATKIDMILGLVKVVECIMDPRSVLHLTGWKNSARLKSISQNHYYFKLRCEFDVMTLLSVISDREK